MNRGLTLLETLAATVLLAMIAAACIPTLVRSMMALRPEPISDSFELNRVADEFLAAPSAFGMTKSDWMVTQDAFTIPFELPEQLETPTATQGEDVDVFVLRAADEEVNHVWVTFQSRQQVASRWIKRPADKALDQGATP